MCLLNNGNVYDGVIDFHQNLIEIWLSKSIFTSKKCHLDFMCLCIYTYKQSKLQHLYYRNINPKLLTCFNISLISIFDVIKTLILMLQIIDFFFVFLQLFVIDNLKTVWECWDIIQSVWFCLIEIYLSAW